MTIYCDHLPCPPDESRLYDVSPDFSSLFREMAEIDIADENFLKLKQIQHVIQEDGIESSMDETLARVLDFYRKFVPYN